MLMPDSFGSRGARGSQCKVKKRVANEDDLRPLDAAGALKFLSTRPEIDQTRIVIAGWSNGAMTTLYTVREGSPAAPRTRHARFSRGPHVLSGLLDDQQSIF